MIMAVERLQHNLRLVLALGLLLAVPLLSNLQHVTAAEVDMTHKENSMNTTDCAAFCATRTVTAPEQALPPRNEVRVPDPKPAATEPYFVPFQKTYTTKAIYPSYALGSYAIRPPDIVTWYATFRI